MKLFLAAFVFLISLPSAAQYKDLAPGEYYNDDLITDKPKMPQSQIEIAPEKPVMVSPIPRAKKPLIHSNHRKPASLFEEVKPSQRQVGDFQDVNGPARSHGKGVSNR
jgi:hypothetical protein